MSTDNYLEENRRRLITLLSNIPASDSPDGWEYVGGIAISGFIGFGFSKLKTNVALVVTTSGRSLVDCSSGEKIARDYEEAVGIDHSGIFCRGIEELSEEDILISGQNGGGLPLQTCIGESLSTHSPNWPQYDLYFCGALSSSLYEKFQKGCVKIRTDFIEAVGFSWCGDYFAVANNSDFDVWKRA